MSEKDQQQQHQDQEKHEQTDQDQQGSGDPNPSDKTGDEDKSFTQDQVNGIVAKENRKFQEKLLNQLGVENFDNTKEGIEKYQEWQQQQLTEQQRLEQQQQKLQDQVNAKDEENASLKAQISAMSKGVNGEYLSDVITLAKSYVTDDTDLEQALDQVIKKFPHFSNVENTQHDGHKPRFTDGNHQSRGGLSEAEKFLQGFKGSK